MAENRSRSYYQLKKDHSGSPAVLEKVLKLAENIGSAYEDAPYLLKRKYLGIFFQKFLVKNGKIVNFSLSDELKPLLENGSALVATTGLPDVSALRTHFLETEDNFESIFL